MVSVFF